MVVENAFGRLKGRWRCLLKRIDFHISNIPFIVGSCVTLHNICEKFGDNCLEEWVERSEDEHTCTYTTQTCTSQQSCINTATSIRRALTIYLNDH